MPQANKDFILNYTANRWGLNKKINLGPTSDSIRLCQPSSKEEWSNYYYSNVRSVDQIDELGRKLYQKLTTIVSNEVRFHPDLLNAITEDDCIEYMHYVAVETPYIGYLKEHGIG